MPNPFSYGGIVAGKSFCNRTRELKDLTRAADNGERLFIHGERRIGKTSLLKSVIAELELKGAVCFYIDVWKCVDEADFLKTCASAMTPFLLENSGGVAAKLGEFFSSLAPALTVDETGKPTFTLIKRDPDHTDPDLELLLRTPGKIRETGKTVLVVFDEFQQVREISGLKLERLIRSIVQEQTGVAWFFCGSRTTILKEMFLNKGNPLYRSSGHYPIESIAEKQWIEFITEEFSSEGKTISEDTATHIVRVTEGHPFYTQILCSALWDITGESVETADVEKSVEMLLEREKGTYSTLWHSLPEQPRKMLRAVAMEGLLEKPTSGSFIRKYGFSSASTSGSALKHLIRHDHVGKNTHGQYYVIDRFLAMWCRKFLAT